jgi:hypothetical protein
MEWFTHQEMCLLIQAGIDLMHEYANKNLQ